MKKKKILILISAASFLLLSVAGCGNWDGKNQNPDTYYAGLLEELLGRVFDTGSTEGVNSTEATAPGEQASVEEIPAYSGELYVVVNNNIPFFTEDEYTTEKFEKYSDLDSLGRAGTAYANLCTELLPIGEGDSLGQIKPTGWQTIQYDSIEGGFLYNRCHLIAYELAGEKANEMNIITGTRALNVEGMKPFEDEVLSYVESSGNHVLYRVTPLYTDSNLVCDGLLIEAYSVEDNGAGIKFNVFCYNVQPGIVIDYLTGDSSEGDPIASAYPTSTTNTTGAELSEFNARN